MQPGTSTERTDVLTRDPAEALAGLLDIGLPDAEALPPLWHWVYLLERPAQRELGPDGHPSAGVPAPPEPGRLRMFAGGRVESRGRLRYGRPATRTARVVRAVDKVGRAGPMTFVTVAADYVQDGVVVVRDEQDLVYRQAGRSLPPAADGAAPDGPADFSVRLHVDPVVLFRFSALTYNAHRIHYDLAYSRAEGYPDLVVHGPLQALLMGECVRRAGLDASRFAYRLVRPTYGAQRLAAHATVRPDGVRLRVEDGSGRTTATGEAALGAAGE